MGLSDLVVNESCSTMLIPSMNISCLMIHAKKIEEHKITKVSREVKREMTDDENSSKGKFEVQGKQGSKNGFPTMFFLALQESTNIVYINLSVKKKIFVVLRLRDLLVQCVV